MTRPNDVNGERWARESPLPQLEGGKEPWPAWRVFLCIAAFAYFCMRLAWDVRALVEWVAR